MAFDISGIVGQTGVALEAQAYNQFGAAVQNQVGAGLSAIFPPGQVEQPSSAFQNVADAPGPQSADASIRANAGKPTIGAWDTTRYSSAIVDGAGNYDPKNKFLFKVQFRFYPEVQQMANSISGKGDITELTRELSFIVKQIDLPKYSFDYEEVNMYNFRTKVLKQIKHEELGFVFYDDTANRALDFVNIYMMLLMPITRVDRSQISAQGLEDHGFAFAQNYKGLDTSMRTALGSNRDILKSMTITQYYLKRSSTGGLSAAYSGNNFTFINPRLVSFDIQDQDHEKGSEPTTVQAKFDYDALHIDTGINAENIETVKLDTADILSGLTPQTANAGRGSQSLAGKVHNPFIDIIANQGQRMVSQTVGGLLQKNLGGIAGGALSGTISTISGTLGTAASKTLSTQGTGIAGSISLPKLPFVNDNSAPAGSGNATQVTSIPNNGWGEG
jgi:hypothetical protein